MRTVLLNLPHGGEEDPRRIAALTRHLNARLLDFGPGGPEVLSFDTQCGLVRVDFPGRCTGDVLQRLSRQFGVQGVEAGGEALFYLRENTRFEDLDYVWGCLFDLLT